MSGNRISTQLDRVREQIEKLQSKEKELALKKQMADDAETMKIIRKNKISPDRLRMLNKLSEDEVRQILAGRKEGQKEDLGNENGITTQDGHAIYNDGSNHLHVGIGSNHG